MRTMAENANGMLDASVPVLRMGKKMIAVEERSWKGNPQLSIREVTPVVSRSDPRQVEGWISPFRGAQLQGPPDDMRRFVSELYDLVVGKPSASTSSTSKTKGK